MCGRYALYSIEEIGSHYGLTIPDDLAPNWNTAPTQHMPVVRSFEAKNALEIMHWGIPRSLGKDLVKDIFNTRADKAFTPFWKKQVMAQRCLVPFNSFYEWKLIDGKKVPFIIKPKDGKLFSFAGIWSAWTDKAGITFNSYSIMTTEPNKEMSNIHNCMPVILYPEEEREWVDPELSEDGINRCMHPYHDRGLSIEEGSPLINNTRTNEASLVVPVNSK